ncbi:MAG TPA: DUF4214 domain-containing protein [Hyphomicrobiaceae bacterium]|nr:DUF4214 domain-containing protein [Hyphomicrobiaceae bacterium]
MHNLGRLCLCVLISAALALPAVAQAEPGRMVWGINGHPFTAYPGTGIAQQIDYVQELGMTSYRVNITSPAQASELAALVSAGKARGIDILPVLTPQLDLDNGSTEGLYRQAYDVAFQLVSRFKDDIRVWELGNELENYAIIRACEPRDDGTQYNCAWGPAGGVDPLDYYGPRWAKVSAVLKGLSDATTAVDPGIRKAIGTAGWGHIGAFQRIENDGIRWDISVWHMYGQDPEWAFRTLAGFKRPIWVTELNHPGGSVRSSEEQADGLVRAMTRLSQLRTTYNVEAAYIYELMDEPYWAPSTEAVMGLVTMRKAGKGWRPGERKPAFHAARKLVAAGTAWLDQSRDCHGNPLNRLSQPAAIEVSYAYCLALGRQPDGAGFKAWTAALQKGTSVPDMLQNMLASEEFRATHGAATLDDAGFTRLLYRVLLNREPDDGLAGYVAQLEQGAITRSGLARRILDSAEFAWRHPVLAPATRSARADPPAAN